MVGLGKAISHTKASISYGWNEEKDAKVVFKKNLAGETPKEITEEFKIIQAMNKNCTANTFSFVLSPTIEDGKKLSLNDLYNITNEFVNDLKFEDHQAVSFVHNDKEHIHIHLYINRINFQGKAYSDSYISKRAIKAAERVAIKLKLTTVREAEKKKLEKIKDIRNHVKEKHDYCIKESKPIDFDEYINLMKQYNIKVIPHINKSGELQGFRYQFKDMNLKASQINRNMSFKNIKEDILINNKTKSKSKGNNYGKI